MLMIKKIIALRPPLVKMLFIVIFIGYVSTWHMYFYILMRLETGKLRDELSFACTIWPLREKEIAFCNVLLMSDNYSLYIKYFIYIYIMYNADNWFQHTTDFKKV